MSKGLEALENIKGNCDLFDEGYQWDNEFSKQFDLDIDIIEQELKILEILREKRVDLWLVDNCDYENYVRIRKKCEIDSNVYCDDGAVVDYTITKNEFGSVQNWLDEGE